MKTYTHVFFFIINVLFHVRRGNCVAHSSLFISQCKRLPTTNGLDSNSMYGLILLLNEDYTQIRFERGVEG